MKLSKTRHVVRAAIVGGLATVACAANLNALPAYLGSRDHVTINREVALPGVVLARGLYTFEETRLGGKVNVIRVTSRDRSRVYYTGLAWSIPRPADMPANQAITFAEVRAGQPLPINAWFPTGQSHGNRFVQ